MNSLQKDGKIMIAYEYEYDVFVPITRKSSDPARGSNTARVIDHYALSILLSPPFQKRG